MVLCDYGCGQEGKYPPSKGRLKWCCSEASSSCLVVRKKIGESGKKAENKTKFKKGMIPWNKGTKGFQVAWNKNLTKNTSKSVKKYSEKLSPIARKRCLSGFAKILNAYPRNPEKMKAEFKRRREFCLNGHAIHMNRCLTNPSKDQVKLNVIISELCPYPEMNYPVYRGKGKKNYSIDIAVSKLDLAFEFDGYWHFNSEKRKEKDIQRQKDLEEEGWKFIRYNIFQKFPTKEQVWNDIQRII